LLYLAGLETYGKHGVDEGYERSCYVVSFKVCVKEEELDLYMLDFFEQGRFLHAGNPSEVDLVGSAACIYIQKGLNIGVVA